MRSCLCAKNSIKPAFHVPYVALQALPEDEGSHDTQAEIGIADIRKDFVAVGMVQWKCSGRALSIHDAKNEELNKYSKYYMSCPSPWAISCVGHHSVFDSARQAPSNQPY